jgi:SAM-dependent methyltransferase
VRVTTAGSGEPAFFEYLLGHVPGRVVLNIGAGRTTSRDRSRFLVNVDQVPAPVAGAHPVAAEAEAMPVRTASVDAVVLKDVIEHVPDAVAVLREARRACRPHGRAVVVTPRAVPRAVWNDPTHVRGFTARALVTALSLAGWTVVRPPRRTGGLPGAGRLPVLTRLLPLVMAVPGIGHRLGTNWIVVVAAEG